MRNDKFTIIELSNNQRFSIENHELAHSFATRRSTTDPETDGYDNEYAFAYDNVDGWPIVDELLQHVCWYECKTLKELPRGKTDLKTLSIEGFKVVTKLELENDQSSIQKASSL